MLSTQMTSSWRPDQIYGNFNLSVDTRRQQATCHVSTLTSHPLSRLVRPVLKSLSSHLLSLSPGQPPNPILILAPLREALEGTNSGADYPTLNLYANWCLHPELDRPAAMKFLAAVNDHAREALEHGDEATFQQRFSEMYATLVGTAKLRAEMREIVAALGLPTAFMQSYTTWHRFLQQLFEQVEAKPIQYPNPLTKPAQAQWERCVANPAFSTRNGLPPRIVSRVAVGQGPAAHNPEGIRISEAGWKWWVHLSVPDRSDGDVILQLPAWQLELPLSFTGN